MSDTKDGVSATASAPVVAASAADSGPSQAAAAAAAVAVQEVAYHAAGAGKGGTQRRAFSSTAVIGVVAGGDAGLSHQQRRPWQHGLTHRKPRRVFAQMLLNGFCRRIQALHEIPHKMACSDMSANECHASILALFDVSSAISAFSRFEDREQDLQSCHWARRR